MTASPETPLPSWSDQVPLLIDLATADLEAGDPVRPTMVAFRGDQPLFIATLRPFVSGDHHDPIIEVGALAGGLGADRVLLSLAGRAWSLDDPIPPVLPGHGDLRQHVVVLHQADAGADDPLALSTVVPIDLQGDGSVRTGPALTDQAAEGWVPRALMTIVAGGIRGGFDLADLGLQVRRCEALGHRIAWSPTVTDLVGRARLADLCGDAADGVWGDREDPPAAWGRAA